MAANLALISKGLRVGDRDPVVIQLRQLLAKRGVVANYTVSDPNLFDPGLTQLVKAFQKASGLEADGIVGPRTWGALGGATVGTPPTPTTPPTQNDATPEQPAPAPGFPFLMVAGGLAAAAALYWYARKGKGAPAMLAGFFAGPEEDEAKRIARNAKARKRSWARDEAEEKAAVRAAWELAKRSGPDVTGEALAAEAASLVRTGLYTPAEAAMTARARLLRRTLPAASKASEAIIAERVQAEAARIVPPEYDPDLTKPERVAAAVVRNAERQRIAERMLRTGLGPMKNATKAVTHVRRDPSWNITPGRETAAEIFPEGVRAAIQPPIGGKMRPGEPVVITVDARAYTSDKAYRESMKDRAKATAVDKGVPVRIVGANSPGLRPSLLWTYDPSRRKLAGFRDAVTDSLIDRPAILAKEGDCGGAVNQLLRQRRLRLARTPAEQEIQRRAVTVVHSRCGPELERAIKAAEAESAELESSISVVSPTTRAEAKATGLRAGTRRDVKLKRDAETRAEEAWWAARATGTDDRLPTGVSARGGRRRGQSQKASETTVTATPFVVVPKGGDVPYYLRTETEQKTSKTTGVTKTYTRRRKVKVPDHPLYPRR